VVDSPFSFPLSSVDAVAHYRPKQSLQTRTTSSCSPSFRLTSSSDFGFTTNVARSLSVFFLLVSCALLPAAHQSSDRTALGRSALRSEFIIEISNAEMTAVWKNKDISCNAAFPTWGCSSCHLCEPSASDVLLLEQRILRRAFADWEAAILSAADATVFLVAQMSGARVRCSRGDASLLASALRSSFTERWPGADHDLLCESSSTEQITYRPMEPPRTKALSQDCQCSLGLLHNRCEIEAEFVSNLQTTNARDCLSACATTSAVDLHTQPTTRSTSRHCGAFSGVFAVSEAAVIRPPSQS
jgi:hypothetical protein